MIAATNEVFRLGIHDVTHPEKPVVYVGRKYDSSEFDSRVMRRAIRRYGNAAAKIPGCTLAMSAFEVGPSAHLSAHFVKKTAPSA